MRRFFSRHLFIILGISLPLLLILGVLVMQGVARWNVPAPVSPVLYAYDGGSYRLQHFSFDIVDGRLSIAYRAPEAGAGWDPDVELAVYDPRIDSLRTFRIDAPEDAEPGAEVAIPVPDAIAELRLSEDPVSPDGFRFEVRRDGNRGLLGNLFGYGGGDARLRLTRDGASFPVPGRGGYVLGNVFIGWVVGDG